MADRFYDEIKGNDQIERAKWPKKKRVARVVVQSRKIGGEWRCDF